jgi:hypothetical protein
MSRRFANGSSGSRWNNESFRGFRIGPVTWIANDKDLLSLPIDTVAIALSLVDVCGRRQQHRLEAHRQMGDVPITTEVQSGRGLTYE